MKLYERGPPLSLAEWTGLAPIGEHPACGFAIAQPTAPRPLWSATFVTGLAGRGTGLVIVMNHVLADGIGGLAVLARLVDEIAGQRCVAGQGRIRR